MTIDLLRSTDFEIVRAAKVLARIDAAARSAQVDYLVVGATARNIISVGLLGTAPERQTRDLDIAAGVDSWAEFEVLVSKFDRRHGEHKFWVEESEVDVIPYGGIEQADRTILWPDDHKMNVLGLQEAIGSAEWAILPGGLRVKIPSIPALALLKILAWRDRHLSERRDAVDLATITRWYSEGSYWEILYTEETAMLERFGFDPVAAGAWLLGTHMRLLLDDAAAPGLVQIADDEDLRGRLARDMAVVPAQVMVEALCEGVRDAGSRR